MQSEQVPAVDQEICGPGDPGKAAVEMVLRGINSEGYRLIGYSSSSKGFFLRYDIRGDAASRAAFLAALKPLLKEKGWSSGPCDKYI
jgi:hypothetical protein